MIEAGDLKLSKHNKYGYGYNLSLLDLFGYVCPKEGVSIEQIIAIIDKYIKNNPQEWHQNLDILIDNSLREAKLYFCPSSNYRDDDPRILRYIRQSF